MNRDHIIQTVGELVAKWGDASKDCEQADAFVDQLVSEWTSILCELRRLWAIEHVVAGYRREHMKVENILATLELRLVRRSPVRRVDRRVRRLHKRCARAGIRTRES